MPQAEDHTEGTPYPVMAIRKDFPLLKRETEGRTLAYLDTAATGQKPQCVIDAVARFYREQNANILRGVYRLSEEATVLYEAAREQLKRFLGAGHAREIVFTRGTTESINLVAQAYGREHVGPGDEVVVTEMEHHSNIVPWQMLCEERGARLKVAAITDAGELDQDSLAGLLSDKTRLVAVTQVSNVLGTVNPIREIVRMAHDAGAVAIVDGAQAAPHLAVNVVDLGCDFYACSGHKLHGPTGIGVLYGRSEILEAMRPWQGGGGMIASVTFEKTTFADLPARFEAGTPHIAGAIGLGAAVAYLERIGMDRIQAHEAELLAYGAPLLEEVAGLRLVGRAREKASILSFCLDSVHPHDVAQILDGEGVAVRAGHHCAMPLMQRLGMEATVRASVALYSTREDLERLAAGLHKVKEVFGA